MATENMIRFLRGNVASLPQTATAGAVYFTKDEGLYLGLEDGSYHRYGDFITVADVASLPATGAHETCMYYCESENVLAKWDGEKWVQINKQKTLAELGGVAKSVYDAKMALLEKADTDNATAIGDLSTYVGTIPETATATNIVAYVQEKTAGIATDTALEELTGRVATAEGDIDKLEAAIAEGGSVANAIAEAKKAGTDAQATADSKTTMAEVEAKGYQNAEQVQAIVNGKDGAIQAAQDKADSAYTLAEGKATMEQVNAAIAGAGHAVKAEVDTAIENLGKAYVAADEALETKLQGNIDKKVDQTAYDTKVGELAGEDARLAGLISDMDTAYKAADTALDGRVATLEGTITGLSGAMHFKGVKEDIPADVTGYADGDVIIVGDKEYVFNGGAFVEFGDVSAEGERIGALETVVGKAAEGENEATGLVKAVADNAAAIAAEKARAEGKEAELAGADATNLQAAKDYADAAVEALKIGDYAKQADLDAHTGDAVAHITADERAAWNAAEKNAKDHADGLNTAMNTRVEALEAIDHDHAHYEVIEGITAEKVATWDGANAYADQAKADAIAAAAVDAANKDAVVLAEAQKGITAVQGALDTHTGNGDIHITAAERTAWNAAEQNAKDYAKGLSDTLTAQLQWGSF